MMEHLLILFSSALIFPSSASFCGSSGVPFSFEVLPSGAPVLGCAQPSCVASLEDKEEDSNFLVNADGQTDGFLREGDKENKRNGDQYANKLIANCSGKFADLTCPRKDQWVGGIEYIDHPRQPLILQCCTFAGLRFSQEVGVTNVGPGEAITGGEVIRDGRQISFDVIANARKVVDANTHIVSYEVTVRRMNCLPDPPEPVVDFEKGVSDEVVKVLTKATDRGTLQKEKTLKKEKLENAQGEKAFAAATIQKTDDRKQRKKTGIEEKENIETSVPDGTEVAQTPEQTETQHAAATADVAALPTDVPPVAPRLGGEPNLEVGAGGTGGTFSSGLGFGGGRIPPEFQGQTQASFGKPPQGGTLSNQGPPQPAYAGPEQGFAPTQQGFGPSQFGQGLQQGPDGQFYRPSCAQNCNRPACPTQLRCNEGRDPIFGIPTLAPPFFPTLFPTLPPHTFPTFAPHSFPTPPPHTFPTFPPHTYPTIAPPPPAAAGAAVGPSYLGPPPAFGSRAGPALGAPTHIAAGAIGEIPGDASAGGGLAPFSFPTIAPATATPSPGLLSSPTVTVGSVRVAAPEAPVFAGGRVSEVPRGPTFAPLPSFEEFMARLHNMTLAPITFGPPSTPVPVHVPLPTTRPATAPEAQPQLFIQNANVAPTPVHRVHTPGSAVYYASQQWSPPGADLASNALPRTVYQQS